MADMITDIDAADYLTLAAAWRLDKKMPANREIASAKLFATEALARVADEALQIFWRHGAYARFAFGANLARRAR